jgi:hypothetical protein
VSAYPPLLHDPTSNTNTQTTTSLVQMTTDSMLQILFGVIGTLATMLGVWVAWRMNRGMVIFDRSKPRHLMTFRKGSCHCKCLRRRKSRNDRPLPVYLGQFPIYPQAHDRGRIAVIRMEDMDRHGWQGHWLPTRAEQEPPRFLALINDASIVRL